MSIFTKNIKTNENFVSKHSPHIEHYDNKDVQKNMHLYIKKKNDILDRKIVLVNNYSIINQNHITLLKYFFYVLIIMNIIYAGVTFSVIPKIIASMVLSCIAVIFFVLVIITILKNSRLYKINMEEKYYPKHNPYNLLHYLTKKKPCAGTDSAHLKKKNTYLDTLQKLLLEIKKLSSKFELYTYTNAAAKELQLINKHALIDTSIYGPYADEAQILTELDKHTRTLQDLKFEIKTKENEKIQKFKTDLALYKKNMELANSSIQKDKHDKQHFKKLYTENKYKFNMMVKNIQSIEKNLKHL